MTRQSSPTRTRVRAISTVAVLIVCGSCSGTTPSAEDASPSTSPVTVSSSPAPEAPESVSPAPSLATAPPELQGSWEATISTGEDVTLELRPSGYTVNRAGAVGSGSIDVDGDRIVFSSARCELGNGTYEWSIQDATLTFTPVEPRDPCGNRIIFLEGASYTRED